MVAPASRLEPAAGSTRRYRQVMPVRRAKPRLAALLAAAAVALTACSNAQSASEKRPRTGTGTASIDGGVQVVTLTTGNDYRFHPSTIVVYPGRVRIVLDNTARSGAPHNLQVTGLPAAFVPTVGAGNTTMATFTAPAPGEYTFVCTIHEAQGQTGKLIVKPGRR